VLLLFFHSFFAANRRLPPLVAAIAFLCLGPWFVVGELSLDQLYDNARYAEEFFLTEPEKKEVSSRMICLDCIWIFPRLIVSYGTLVDRNFVR
jgi:hypothetical protein